MANTDAPHGLAAVMMLNGGKIPMHQYTVAATTAIYKQDIVTLRATGLVATCKTATTAVANVIGVAAHYAAVGTTVLVYDDPMTIFEAQTDSSTAPGATTSLKAIGAGADLGTIAQGSTTTKLSKMEIDYTVMTTCTGGILKIVGIYDGVRNDSTLGHLRYLVILNTHLYGPTTTRQII